MSARCWAVGTNERAKRPVVLVEGQYQQIERTSTRIQPVIRELIIASTHKVAGNVSIYKEVYRGRGKHEYSCVVGDSEYTGFKNIDAVRNWLTMHLFNLEKAKLT